MKELDLALDILNNDLDNGVPFQDALRQVFANDPTLREYRPNVAGLVGCALRHYQLLNYLTFPLSEFSVEEKRLVGLAMANDHYFRHIPAPDMDAALKERLGEEKFEKVKELLTPRNESADLIPASVAKTSNLYMRLRFNVPDFALRIMQGACGLSGAYRTIRAYASPRLITVRQTERFNPEANPDVNLEPTKVDGIYSYKGKMALPKTDAYRKHEIFEERPYVKMIMDQMAIKDVTNLLVYSGQPDMEWELETLESLSPDTNVNIASEHFDKKVRVSQMIKRLDLHNVNFFAAEDPDMMVAAISNPCEVVIAVPNSSMFDRIPSTPDYLLHYSREAMEPVYQRQYPVLAGCAKHVAQGGRLVYCVPTLSRKEGHSVVARFLEAHKEFVLDKETQLFPGQEYHVTFYYAVLYKGEKAKDVDTPPLTELLVKPEAPVSSAKAE